MKTLTATALAVAVATPPAAGQWKGWSVVDPMDDSIRGEGIQSSLTAPGWRCPPPTGGPRPC